MATIIFFKLIFFITIVFFSYIGYFAYTEYKAFSNGEESKNSSVFEKLIIRTLVFLGGSSLLVMIFSYVYLLFYSNV